MSAIFKALAAAQKHFEAAKKDSKNPHFNSKYADLSSCMDAVREPLNDAGIFLTQTIETVETGILIETLFLHESGDTFSNGKLYIPVAKHDAQGYGSAITYGRRYSLLAACGVAPEDDDGNSASASSTNKPIQKKVITPAVPRIELPQDQIDYLRDVAMTSVSLVLDGKATEAMLALEANKLDDEQKTYLWSLLDSKTRNAIKSAKQKEAA